MARVGKCWNPTAQIRFQSSTCHQPTTLFASRRGRKRNEPLGGAHTNPTEMAVHIEPNSKKGCLFNTFFHHKELIKESVLNQDLFELIDFIGDTELIVVPNLPAFMFDGKVYVAKNKSFTSKADVMSFILSMEKTFAIYSIILEQHVIYNPITFEETDKKQEYYTIQWSPLEN